MVSSAYLSIYVDILHIHLEIPVNGITIYPVSSFQETEDLLFPFLFHI